jgi:hypothetical protein
VKPSYVFASTTFAVGLGAAIIAAMAFWSSCAPVPLDYSDRIPARQKTGPPLSEAIESLSRGVGAPADDQIEINPSGKPAH